MYSQPKAWVNDVCAMIAGRLIFAGSKLSLCNQYNNSTLWEQCGVEGRPDVREHCYETLDKLLERQKAIQKKLAKKHLKNGHLVLYDITSSYLEGEYKDSELVKYGYNRDGKKKHEQIVIGLICNGEGCPIGIEVFRGNTKDQTTVSGKIAEIEKTYKIEQAIFVGDRGMVTEAIADELKEKGVDTIGALTRAEIQALIEEGVIKPDKFKIKSIEEVTDPETPAKRYCLCKNPVSAKRDAETREKLIELTIGELEAIANYKKKTTVEVLGARVGKVLQKYKMGKYIEWEVESDKAIKSNSKDKESRKHKFIWSKKEEAIAKAKDLDGCYVITTRVTKDKMDKEEVVTSYKRLEQVEMAFRNLKTVQLEMRPVYHKLDHRIRAHVFLCMLAYYVQWHMQKCLEPLFKRNKKGWERQWTFAQVIETLKSITRNRVEADGVFFYRDTVPNEKQKYILDLMGVTM
jgi:transposase